MDIEVAGLKMMREVESKESMKELFEEYAKTRDPGVRDRLIESNLGIVEHLARHFSNRGEPHEDLVQVGSLALVKAVDRFDPTREVEFTTYATHTVVGELKRHFRDKGWAVRAPRRVQELYLHLNKLLPQLSQELGRNPTVAELSLATNSSEEDVIEALEAGRSYRFASLDSPGMDEGERPQLGTEDVQLEDVEIRSVVMPLLDKLSEREKAIIYLRFYKDLTQSEIAERLNISQMHVSRLLAQSLSKVRSRSSLKRD